MNKWLVALAACTAFAQDPRQIVEEVQKRAQSKSQQYEGTLEVVDAKSKVSTKRWEYSRLGAFGSSKSVLRFTAPAEVKGVALLVHNHPDRSSDQWMWRPAIERDQRIALQDRSTRFFGTDFSYEDLEERDVNQFDFKLLGEETIDGHPCWKLESRPREKKVSQYAYSYLWIRKDHYIYAQIDAFNKAGLARRIKYSDVQDVQNIWTARTIEVFDAAKKSRTTLKFEKLRYNVPMDESAFTLQALRRAS
ncbi:MAG: outer membrane lipoprotein-sorting protein [Acidobacteria bacterium]|nr:outer membrane lipoprotein-sorting protein [Acidobacteriota bacterium]